MIPISCEITRPFKDKINNFYVGVPVVKNPILKAIIDAKDQWHTSPIIWAGNFAYRIHIISQNKEEIELYQMALSPKLVVLNVRKVRITLATTF
jgi:hypothetical protein